jgi:superfamily II DNA/RNA helicase
LISPGILGTESSFKSRYAEDGKCRKIRTNSIDELRNKIFQVMCRTRRIDTDIPFTKRFVESRRIDAGDDELKFIDKSTNYLKDLYNNKFKTVEELKIQNTSIGSSDAQSRAIVVFQAIILQQSISSSPQAAIETMQKRYENHPQERPILEEIIELAKLIIPSKLELLKQILKEVREEQAVIFCLRKATTNELKAVLNKEFGKAEIYNGDISSSKRKEILTDFKNGDIRYLVATDAAAEGLNLQHCNLLFNYDLHWNPMKIEQRIGRVHRFGQEKDVTIFNLCIKDTIDDYVLHILFQKIELFTMTIGGMETILSNIKEDSEDGADMDRTIMEIVLRSKTKLDIKKELEKLSEDIKYSKKKQEFAEQFTKGVLG